MKVALVSTVRNHPGSVNPMIKSNNLMNSALAMQEAFRSGGFEGVMRNYRGELAGVHDGKLLRGEKRRGAHAAARRGPATRDHAGVHLRGRAEAGSRSAEQVSEKDDDLLGADEAFLTSTTREVVPIVKVDERAVGTVRPGADHPALLAAISKRAHAGRVRL